MILVLGGNGYIGKNLIKALAAGNDRIRVFDRYLTESDRIDRVEYVQGDFSGIAESEDVFEGVDTVVHLIHTTLPSSSMADMEKDVSSNLFPTLKILEIMKRRKIAKIIYLSSGGTVYGSSEFESFKETDATFPICSYGISKLAIEKYIGMYSELYGINGIIIRLSNPYGRDLFTKKDQGVISIFISKILKNEPITIWGDGSNVRDYIYIDDVVSALKLIAVGRINSGVYNLGSGVGTSLNDVVGMIQNQFHEKITILYQPKREFDIKRIVLNTSKIRQVINWEPRNDLKSGIEKILNSTDMEKGFN